jgi:hypothetical protein
MRIFIDEDIPSELVPLFRARSDARRDAHRRPGEVAEKVMQCR